MKIWEEEERGIEGIEIDENEEKEMIRKRRDGGRAAKSLNDLGKPENLVFYPLGKILLVL